MCIRDRTNAVQQNYWDQAAAYIEKILRQKEEAENENGLARAVDRIAEST